MKILVFIIALFGLTNISIAQNEKYVKGSVTKDGKVTEGYIWKIGMTQEREGEVIELYPWEFQETVKFIETSELEKLPKVKQKYFSKISPKEYDGYTYKDQYFEAVKYADMSETGSGIIAKKMFIKRLLDDKISIFEHYTSPDVMSTDGPGEYQSVTSILYRKGKDGKLKKVKNMDIENILSDCQLVLEKHEKGQYKIFEKEDKGTMKRVANFFVSEYSINMQAIEDYNANCGTQGMK